MDDHNGNIDVLNQIINFLKYHYGASIAIAATAATGSIYYYWDKISC
jgi:hypothetical protein